MEDHKTKFRKILGSDLADAFDIDAEAVSNKLKEMQPDKFEPLLKKLNEFFDEIEVDYDMDN